MKNIITILCLFAFAGCAFAEGYYIPSYTPDELGRNTTQNVEKQINSSEQYVEETKTSAKTEVTKKKVRRRGNRMSSPNSYYNFGTIKGFKGKF